MKIKVAVPTVFTSWVQRLKMEYWIAIKKQTNKHLRGYDSKEHLWDFLDASIIQGKKMLYLEFGVYEGASMRYWIGLNTHPQSRFIGFDTFEGLPEAWLKSHPRGMFDAGKVEPDLNDNRCSFIKGLFEDTLEPYLGNMWADPQLDDSILFVNLDADLYRSTACALSALAPVLRRQRKEATIVYFDEFRDYRHEFKAFSEIRRSHNYGFELLGQAENYLRVAFRAFPIILNRI